MIKLYSLYNGTQADITHTVKSVSCTGDKSQAARKLDVALAYPIWDRSQPRTQVGPGTKIWATLDGKEIFRGVAWDREIDSAAEELTFPVYDYLIYFTKSKVTYNFINITPEDATRKICEELGVEAGDIASTGIKVNRLIAQKTGYEAIKEMYAQAAKTNGKEYIPVMAGTKLCVIEQGKVIADYTLRSQLDPKNNNILSSTYKDTMDGMINKVKIYDDKNRYVGEISTSGGAQAYGLLQENYVQEKDKDSHAVAKGMLTDIQRSVTIPALGNWNCRTGYAVNTEIFYISSLQNTVLLIEGDTHNWEPGTGKYTMSLNLSFKE